MFSPSSLNMETAVALTCRSRSIRLHGVTKKVIFKIIFDNRTPNAHIHAGCTAFTPVLLNFNNITNFSNTQIGRMMCNVMQFSADLI